MGNSPHSLNLPGFSFLNCKLCSFHEMHSKAPSSSDSWAPWEALGRGSLLCWASEGLRSRPKVPLSSMRNSFQIPESPVFCYQVCMLGGEGGQGDLMISEHPCLTGFSVVCVFMCACVRACVCLGFPSGSHFGVSADRGCFRTHG